jgi:hypothetical protein
MATDGTDGSRGWALSDGARPPLIGELVERIDEAVAIARASEAAVMTVGAAALDAAEQARRAAELAERASAAMPASASRLSGNGDNGDNGGSLSVLADADDDDMRDFDARADRISARLRQLEQLPFAVAG